MGFEIWLQGEYNEENRLVDCYACKKKQKKKHMIKVGTVGVLKCKKCKKGSDWVRKIIKKNS